MNVVKFSGSSSTPATTMDLSKLGAAASVSSGSTQSVDLLRLLRDGEWVFGADNTEPEEGSLWAVNPYSFSHGYISWVDNKPAGEVMVSVMNRLPTRAELPETGGSWDEQMGMQLQCISGADKGTVVQFKTTSVGGKRSVAKLAAAIGEQAASGSENVVPVATLDVDFYQHKKYGKIYTPVFDVQKWVSMDAELPTDDDAPAPEPEPELVTARRRRSR